MALEWNVEKKPWFDISSISHALFGYFISSLLLNYIGHDLKVVIFSVILHGIEDYLENTSKFSLEGLARRLFKCRNDFLNYQNDDSMQNFLGDNISYLFGAISAWYYGTKFASLGIATLLFIYFLGCYIEL